MDACRNHFTASVGFGGFAAQSMERDYRKVESNEFGLHITASTIQSVIYLQSNKEFTDYQNKHQGKCTELNIAVVEGREQLM